MMYRTRVPRKDLNLGGVTELRVHGVGGSSPEQVLDVPYTDLVSGDLTAGFFAAPDLPRDGPERRLEAYSWGGLTSRSRLRALWLLLLPFALANLAGWMAERGTGEGSYASWARPVWRLTVASVRIVALATTTTAMLYLAVAGIDLFGYQCGGNDCAQPGRWLSWPLATAWVQDALGRRLVVGAAIPLAVIGFVAFITKRSQDFVHADRPPEPVVGRPLDPTQDFDLRQRAFWRSPHVAQRLGITHTAAALAVIGQMLASTGADLPDLGIAGWWSWLFVGILAASVVGVVAVRHLPTAWNWGLLAVTALAVGTLVVLLVGADGVTEPGPAPGARVLAMPMFLVSVAALVVFWGCKLVLRPRRGDVHSGSTAERRGWRSYWSRMADRSASTVIAVIGWGTVIAVGSGLLIQFARILGSATPQAAWSPATAPADTIVYFDLSGTVAVLTFATMVAVVVAGMAFTGWRWMDRARSGMIATEYRKAGIDADVTDRATRQALRGVARAQAVASVTDYVAHILVIGLVVLVAFTVWSLGNEIPVAWQAAASGVLALLPVAAVFAINRSRESPGVRRGVGILWDIATFWPRWYHPFAPPSYGERAVPQLANRLERILDDGGRVVLSAHSQGSVVGAAALAQLTDRPEGLTGVAFLTHGSPLGRLYARFFGRYFDDSLLRRLSAELIRPGRTGWINLWRLTDFIGGQVFSPEHPDCKEIRLLDPPNPVQQVGESAPSPNRHFNYTDDPAYEALVSELCEPDGALPDARQPARG